MIIVKQIARFLLKRKRGDNALSVGNKYFSFYDVKSVGIVFSARSAEEIDAVRKYMNVLVNAGKRVSAICFYNSKTIPSINNSGLLIDFVLPKEISFWGVPKPTFVGGFIENKFDLLLDLDIQEVFPVEYVSAMSRANFKVGRHSKVNESIFDMMIDIDDKKDISYFISQIDNYLKMINKAA